MLKEKLDKILLKVQKPSRYIGGEVNAVVKDKSKVDIRFAFCFPDGLAKAAEKELGSIAEIKRRLKSAGALAAEMSGSGSACFGIFETLAQAQRAAETFCDMAFCHACAGIGNTGQM